MLGYIRRVDIYKKAHFQKKKVYQAHSLPKMLEPTVSIMHSSRQLNYI